MTMLLEEPTVTTIAVKTLFQGVMEVPETDLITFISPLLGFDGLRRFLLYQTQPGPLYWLQAVDDEKVSFCLLAPFQAGMDPDLEITGEDVADIGAQHAQDIEVYTVVVLDQNQDDTRTNLRAPILFNSRSHLAKQVVLNDNRLPIRFYLRDLGKTSVGH